MEKSASIIVSAPGKVILHGEHAVVYGKRAIAACLDLRTFLRLDQTSNGCVLVQLPDIGLQSRWSLEELITKLKLPLCNPLEPSPPSEELLLRLKDFAGLEKDTTETKQLAVIAFLYLYCSICFQNGTLKSITVKIASNLPTSAGLGSSAAFSSCLASSFLILGNFIKSRNSSSISDNVGSWTDADLKLINSWAFQAEKIIHGNPSGIDNSVSCYGGALNFLAGKVTPLTSVPVLRVMLFNTKVPRSTKALVAGVRKRYNMYPDIVQPVLDAIEAISQKSEQIFHEMQSQESSEGHAGIQDMIDMNQHLLEALGVSHPAIEQICNKTARHGLHTKLTGAGGGGCAFTVIPPGFDTSRLSIVEQEIKSLGYECWETNVGGLGVVQHLSLQGNHFTLPQLIVNSS